jgi:bifunctional non-homologous end joining protein LigD
MARRWCSASTASPISTRCIRAGTEGAALRLRHLALDGEDLRPLPLSLRKTNLARLLARRPDGIFVAPFEQGEIGPDLFRAACNMGLEGLVSKRVGRPYRGGRSPDWVKVKNRKHPAMERVKDAFA